MFAAQSCLLARGRRGEGDQADLQPAGPRQPESRQRARQEEDPSAYFICAMLGTTL